MKKLVVRVALLVVIATSMSSCYVQTHVVGQGAKGTEKVKKWNHYIIGGLIPVGVSKPEELAGGAKDYTEVTKMSFVNGLLSGLTFGIYSPTTTEITK